MKKFETRAKVILITGASSGIGRSSALLFAREGGKVALVSRNANALRDVQEEIHSSGGEACSFPFDLSQTDKILEIVKEIKEKMGPIDILINNAGYAVTGLVEDCPVEEYQKNFDVNFFAPIALIQAVLPDMKKKKMGQIINVSSGVGRRALPGVSAYSSTKFALNGLTESLRLEVKQFGIDVITIFPGRVESHFHERIEAYGRLNRKLPPIKTHPASKIAQMILEASQRKLREATAWGPGAIGYHLNYWFPQLVDRLLLKRFPV